MASGLLSCGLYKISLKNTFFIEYPYYLSASIMKPMQRPLMCKIITHTMDGTNHSLSLCKQGKVRLAENAKLTLPCVILFRKVFQ